MRILFVLSCCWLSSALAQTASTVTLTRLDCGNEPEPTSVASFSDTYGATDLEIQLTYSCYLIRHGDEYMIWDAGNRLGGGPESPKTSLVELLGKLKIKPEQVKYLGISHHHYDHIGQAASFPQATLLIGKGDWEALTAEKPPERMTPDEFTAWRSPLTPWISLPRELQEQRRADLELQSGGHARLARPLQGGRQEPARHGDHPARSARHRQAPGLSRRGPVTSGKAFASYDERTDAESTFRAAALTLRS
jgi:hypothetical protein